MEYLVHLGVALVRRWIEWIGWRTLDEVVVVLILLAFLIYVGMSVFTDEG